jgi:16S rRNA (guanine(966)-N(2))-methyltransferase RsmD
MRVISGSARGRKLIQPEGGAVRPTTDMVKEALFNIIQFDLEGRRVLDLFSGTGQLGIEALSRGAASALFVDPSAPALRLVRANLRHTELAARAEVYREDALAFLRRGGRFDIVFIDPPYESALAEKALAAINEFDILNENGIIICETKADARLPDLSPPYAKGREYRYGRIRISLYLKEKLA